MKTVTALLATLLASLTLSARPSLLADGPGIPKVTFAANEVYKPLSFIHAPAGYAHGQAAMVHGYLFVPFFRDATPANGGFDFYDISNPRNPVLVFRKTGGTTGLREPHAFGSTNGGNTFVLQGTDGIEFWDFANPLAPQLLKHLTLPNITMDGGYGGVWWTCWQAPIVYCAGNDQGLYIVDATDPSNPFLVKRIPINSIGGFPVGSTFAVGNLLVMASTAQSDSNALTTGGKVTTMDISDPRNPVLIGIFNTVNGYSSLVNGDKLLVAGVNNMFHVLNLSNPANVTTIGSIDLGGPGGYVSFQDGFAHSGYGTKCVKVNVQGTAPTLAASGSSGITDKDDNFAVPLGNMIFAGNDHPAGSALLVHQAAPDNTGPAVNMVNPKNGATAQALSSRVGLTFTDEIDSRTLNTATLIVRPVGGSPVAGKYSYQTNLVNFFPNQPLAAGTDYEVVVPAGGIRDYSGNAVTIAFRSTFTTAGTAPGGSKNALLVVGVPPLSAGDTALRSRLQGLGYTVTVVDASTAASGSATGMQVVVISESVETTTGIGTVFTNTAVPVVTAESGIFSGLKMTGPTLNTDYGTVAGQTQITIVDPTHPLAAGLSGTVTVVTAADSFDFGVPASSAKKVATLSGQPGKYSLFGYESGAAMVGMNAPARRVAWFAENSGGALLNANGGAIFDAAITWAAGTVAPPPPPGNVLPTVSLTSPSTGMTFSAPASLTLTATASDSDGTIAKVEFYSGATLLGTELGAPYHLPWNNVPAGTYSLTAKATDNAGGATTSAPVSITVTSPGGAGQSISKWVLIDSATGQPLPGFNPLNDGALLNVGTLPTASLEIWAETLPATVGSVRFAFDGNSNYRMENAAAYSLGTAWTSLLGAHAATATPYSQANGAGTPGAPSTITFTVLHDPSTPSSNGGGSPVPPTVPATKKSGGGGGGGCGLLGLEGLLVLGVSFLRRRKS